MAIQLKQYLKPKTQTKSASLALLAMRLIAGAAFALHGFPKIQNPTGWMGPDATVPAFFLLLAAVSEFFGGIAWLLGLVTPIASLGIAITMLVATYFHAVIMGDPFVGKGSSYELALIYFGLSLVFMLVGPGKFSLDAKIFGERK